MSLTHIDFGSLALAALLIGAVIVLGLVLRNIARNHDKPDDTNKKDNP